MKVFFILPIFISFIFYRAKSQPIIEFCTGVDSVINTHGFISSLSGGDSTYHNLDDCSLLIHPFCADSIFLSFSKFSTEFQHDSIIVYDGVSTNSPVLLSHSGNNLPPDVVSTSGAMLIVWHTDSLNVDSGFIGEWRTVTTNQLTQIQCYPYVITPCCGSAIYDLYFIPQNISGHNILLNPQAFTYTDFTCIDSISLYTNTPYDFIITGGQAFDQTSKGWIDYNNDAIFDSSELFINVWGTYTVSSTFNIDSNLIPSAFTGRPVRMRFISNILMNSVVDACSNIQAGGIVDYGVSFVRPPLQTSLIAPENYHSFSIYPNPINGEGIVKFSLTKNSNVSIRIIDLLGKQEYPLIDNEIKGGGQYEIPLHLPAGYYVVEFMINGSVDYRKIISLTQN